ncbi:MAG: T9SS type A sorting domain-containing protein, partial [Bacteroidota bacterium]
GNTLSDAAPWVDVDGDPTAYTPDQGDHPLLKGDAMVWWVFNDVGPDPSNDRYSPNPLGVEVHAMVYGYDCPDTDLQQSLLLEYQVINRSNFSYQDVYLGQWTDFELGGFLDDYTGVDTTRGMFYGYNGDNCDTQFGTTTPALGVQFLRGGAASPNDGIDNDADGVVDEAGEDIGLTHFMTYPNNFVITPVTPVGHYGLLQSIFPDTLNPLTDHAVDNYSNGGPGNGHPDSAAGPLTDFLYSGDICQQSGWTMGNAGAPPLDIRGMGSSGPFALSAGASDTIVMAFLVSSGDNHLQNTCDLGPKADYVRDCYEAGADSCALPGQVYPGDANHDRVADVWDILPIGLHYLSSGPARPNASLNWIGQNAPDWTDSLTSGVNLKHVDTDGNGTIDLDDTLAIDLNYGLTHLSQKREIQSGGAPLYFTASSALVNPGDTVSISVWLGTVDTIAQDVYGIAFSMEYDTSQVASIELDMSPTWLGTIGQDLLVFSKNLPEAGQLDIAQVRLNQSNISGYGRLANIIVVMDDDIAKQLIPFSMSVRRLDMIDRDANSLAVSVEPLAVNISTYLESPIEVIGLSVYPNPTQDHLQIRWQQVQETHIRLLTPQGSVILDERSAKRASSHALDLSELPTGIYLLEVRQQEKRSLLRVV